MAERNVRDLVFGTKKRAYAPHIRMREMGKTQKYLSKGNRLKKEIPHKELILFSNRKSDYSNIYMKVSSISYIYMSSFLSKFY